MHQGIQTYFTNLTVTEATYYSLWKATRELKRPPNPISPLRTAGDELAKRDVQKTVVFVDHFESVFCPYPPVIPENDNQQILRTLTAPGLHKTAVKPFTIAQVQKAILNPRATKFAGYDLINGKVLHEISAVAVRAITYLCKSSCERGTSLPNGRSHK
jgi:hypothetical protein